MEVLFASNFKHQQVDTNQPFTGLIFYKLTILYMSEVKKVETDQAPAVVGPYSQAVVAGQFIFCSGQIAINPVSNILVEGGIRAQTEQVIKNVKNILAAASVSLGDVVKTEVYLQNMNDFGDMNEIYKKYFDFEPLPSRVTVEVARLPKKALIEIACLAFKK